MKKRLLLAIIPATLVLLAQLYSCGGNNPSVGLSGEDALKQFYTAQTDSLLLRLDQLLATASSNHSLPKIRAAFAACRMQYKRTEAVSEYYFQGLTHRINGPALPDVSIEDGRVWQPHGFQVIEQSLYGFDKMQPGSIAAEIRLLQTDLRFMQRSMEQNPARPHHVRELLRHEFIRIATLGITGFDASLSKLSLDEAAASLSGLRDIIALYDSSKEPVDVKELFDQAMGYLHQHRDFESFDRLVFITDHLMPLSEAVDKMQRFAEPDGSTYLRPFAGTLSELMRGAGFDADYYSGYAAATSSPSKVALGQKLFFDPRLSASGTTSCGSCHKPGLFLTDGHPKASDFLHGGSLARNTPTLYYAALQSHQFYDMRTVSLEAQADAVMASHNELNSPPAKAAKKLWTDPAYRALFKQAFSMTEDTIGGFEVRNALAAYVRSLSAFSSPFDDYMRGNRSALLAEQVQGFNLFAGKAKCASCHFIPLFNGNFPPWFTRSESEIVGVPERAVWTAARIDPDSGRFKAHRFPELLHAFKTPTLRNVAKTAPYMHNGVYKTLDEVIEFYNRGGGAGIGIVLPSQSLPSDSLSLSAMEKKAIISFLQSLTDRPRP